MLNKGKLVLIGSILSFFYFFSYLLISYFEVHNVLINSLAELLTIPFAFLLLTVTFMSIKNWIKEKFAWFSIYLASLLFSILAMVILYLLFN